MKDSEFIELLNLYVDHEIGAADAAKLEAEVQTNPERRRLYHQYCAMQKACTELAGRYLDVEVPEPKVVAFSPRRQAWYPAALAAAACLTVFLFIRTREAAPAASPTSAPVVFQPNQPPTEPGRPELQKITILKNPQGLLARSDDQSLDWLKDAQTQFQPLVLDSAHGLKMAPERTLPLAGASNAQPTVPNFQSEKFDWVAFKLQRGN